jgi:hypothetical protein
VGQIGAQGFFDAFHATELIQSREAHPTPVVEPARGSSRFDPSINWSHL